MTFAAEVIISGFVSKAVNNCVDVSWDKIKNAVKNKNNKHQSLESQIYNVTVDVFNLITYNQYKNNQDKIYEAAELLLLGFKSNKRDDIEVIRSSLKLLFPYVDNDKCMEFKELLYQILSKDDYEALYREIRLLQEEQESRKTTRIERKVDEIKCGIDDLKSNSQMQSIPQNDVPRQKVKSRTQEYADKWNANMFLNDFDDWDENAGVNIKLSDVYIEDHLPHFIWGQNEKKSKNLNEFLSKYIDNKNDNKMLLILGQPGIGKSTLITWITANYTSRVDDIMVYQFAADLKDIGWQKANISIEILDALNLSYDDLNGKTLILDGLDEISVGDRKEILDKIYWELIKGKNVERFSLIITCRENYINSFERIQCKYITLLPWDKMQIKSFCTTFQDKTKCDISEYTLKRVIENKNIFGIPLILYMVLALNISVEKEGSIVDIYDKIFSLEGGIYDRCIENKNFAYKHRIGDIKEHIHQISREIAVWMFENEPNEAYIPQEEYKKICDGIIKAQRIENKDIQQDFLIGNFFKLKHCEGVGTEKLYFVHRSIYEYFVAETIYTSVENAMLQLTEESKKELAGNIAVYLKEGQITNTIGEYLQYKILKLFQRLDGEKKGIFYQWWESTVGMMMVSGMFYFTKRNIQDYKDIIYKEAQCFVNFMIILRLLLKTGKNSHVMQDIDKAQKEIYIKLILAQNRNSLKYVNLSKMSLTRINLAGEDLEEADLSGTDLSGADLSRANLRVADLRRANLNGTDFRGAILRGAKLRDTNYRDAYFDESSRFETYIWKALSPLKKARSKLSPDENS